LLPLSWCTEKAQRIEAKKKKDTKSAIEQQNDENLLSFHLLAD